MTLVDANVLLDLITDDPFWYDWSRINLDKALLGGPLIINDVIYAEVSSRLESVEAVDDFLRATGLEHTVMPRHALFLAAKAFRRYRGSAGARTGVLPDFFIGAHAAVLGVPVLTRDVRRYRTYFPDLRLIAPPVN